MAFISASTGGPPGTPGSAVLPCMHPRGFLVIRVLDQRANGQPALADTEITVTVGAYAAQNLTTDANGQVTLVFDAAADFANAAVSVVLRTPSRLWPGQASTAGAAAAPSGVENQTITQVNVPVAGTFTLNVRVTTRRPGTGADIGWVHAWNSTPAQLRRVTTPDAGAAQAAVATDLVGSGEATPVAQLTVRDLECVASHDFDIQGIAGIFPDPCEVRLAIDGAIRPALDAVGATHNQVRYSRQDGNLLRVAVERHGAVVDVEYFIQFQQFLIVGEGTSYEYAVNLARRYGDASSPNGFKWIVATQYDVVDPAVVSTAMNVLEWDTGAANINHNQRQSVQDALARNMIRRAEQFDATTQAHWGGVLATYGAFDACIFNNPHIGYGAHMCVVMGLTMWQAGSETAKRFANKNGMAVSVHSLGYPHARRRDQLDRLLGSVGHPKTQANVQARHNQRAFVRANTAGCLDYRNAPGTAIAFQYRPADCAAVNIDIQTAFVYEENGHPIDNARYGNPNEFPNGNAQKHYSSMYDTLGLQGFLLRSYRHHAPSVLKNGGWVYINGSNHWARELTGAFNFGPVAVDAMINVAAWPGHDTFVHYNTNFTSNDHHPSWYSQWNFNPGEPNIQGARVFGRQY